MLVLTLSTFSKYSSANEIYINQVGDNLTMEVVQDGEDNYFQYCSVNNDTNCTDVDGNTHARADGVASDDSAVYNYTTGNNNRVVVAHAAGQNNGNSNESTITVTGDDNKVENFFSNSSSGSHSYSNMDWGGHKETDIDITGDDNTVSHSSDSYGEVYGGITVSGDDNEVNLYQRSMRNTATINVTNAGGPVTANIQQRGSSYQDTALNSISVTNYCTTATGCTVNITQN